MENKKKFVKFQTWGNTWSDELARFFKGIFMYLPTYLYLFQVSLIGWAELSWDHLLNLHIVIESTCNVIIILISQPKIEGKKSNLICKWNQWLGTYLFDVVKFPRDLSFIKSVHISFICFIFFFQTSGILYME